MAINKVLVSSMIILFSLTSIAFCQKQNRVEKRTSEIQAALQLDSEQTEKLAQILTVQEEMEQKNREQYKDNEEELETARKTLHKETDKQIEEILTDEQKELYKEYKKERRSKKGDRSQRDGKK